MTLREPVRIYLYSLVVAIVSALVAFGILDGNLVPVILGLAVTILAVPAVEAARSRVTPVTRRK